MFKAYIAVVLPFLTGSANAICGGFVVGISNQVPLGNGISRWDVFDEGCNVVDGLTTNENPCTVGTFSCSPPPIFFDGYTNTFSGQHFSCQRDPDAENCNGESISVCCR